jgi:hypothetical protein
MSLQELKNRSRIVRDETQFKANTASRIGQLFMDIVDYLMTLVNASHTHSNKTVIDNLTDSIGNASSQNGGKLMYRGQIIESSSGQVSSWVQTPVISVVSSLPSSPSEGDRYIYLINNKIYEYNGVSWELDPATDPSAVSGSAVIVREDSEGDSLNHIFIYENGSWVDRDSDYSSTRFLTNFDTVNGRHSIQFVGSPNELTQSGFYYGSDNVQGNPIYVSGGGLSTAPVMYEVISIDILNCKQIAYTGGVMYVRDLMAGVWSEWVSQSNATQLSKVVSVNYDLTTDDELGGVFKLAENAQTWITANGGTLSASNTWTIKLPSGLITEPLVKLPFIEFEVSTGTIIDELTSGVAYSTSADLFKAVMKNAQINTLIIPSRTCTSLSNCNTASVEIEDDASMLFVQGGFHRDLDLGNSECNFDNVRINGSLFSNFNNATFTRSTLQNNITIALGETLTLVDSVYGNSITNNGTLNNYQPTFDSDLTASEANKGFRRYKETANSSSFEIVMKTGVSTYEWVKIKENTW